MIINHQMGFNDICNPGLVLGLAFPTATIDPPPPKTKPHNKPIKGPIEPNLTLALSGEMTYFASAVPTKMAAAAAGSGGSVESYGRQAESSYGTVSSFSSPRPVKRERDPSSSSEEVEAAERKAGGGDEDDVIDVGVNARKKLRLTKEQSALLEESFKQHSTLNPKQKQALARQLNLRPRQVEVWFQNRRARTKLKQTEVDCEFLKKCCEKLTDENRRLQKELHELKATKNMARPFYYMNVPTATLNMCPSCERVGGGDNKAAFQIMASNNKAHAYNPFANPSAAC